MAVVALSAFPLSSDVPTLACSVCGGNAIPTPLGTTEHTRFTCRRCCARIARRQNLERLRLAQENSSAARRMANIAHRLFERGKTPEEIEDANADDSTLN